ncbi:hypothetical protein [Streptomyces monashensis]|uniref:hypothetical protein n=1 Tax=Streptomyces monashensis TaxID=1678012 RepID=UPI001FE65B2D|nr:hypothetical protein [Streptomyces monashensis]
MTYADDRIEACSTRESATRSTPAPCGPSATPPAFASKASPATSPPAAWAASAGTVGAFTVLDDLTAFLRYMLDSPITGRGPRTDIRNAFRGLAFNECCNRDGSP